MAKATTWTDTDTEVLLCLPPVDVDRCLLVTLVGEANLLRLDVGAVGRDGAREGVRDRDDEPKSSSSESASAQLSIVIGFGLITLSVCRCFLRTASSLAAEPAPISSMAAASVSMATVADCCRVSSSFSSCSFDSGCVDPASSLKRLLDSFGFFLDADTGVAVDAAGAGGVGVDCSLAAVFTLSL